MDDEGYLLFQVNQADKNKNSGTNNSKRKMLPKASLFKSYNNLHQFGAQRGSLSALETENDDVLTTTTRPDYAEALPAGKNGLNATIMLPWL